MKTKIENLIQKYEQYIAEEKTHNVYDAKELRCMQEFVNELKMLIK